MSTKLETISGKNLSASTGGWGGWGWRRAAYSYGYGPGPAWGWRSAWGGGWQAMANRAAYYSSNPWAYEQLAERNPWAAERVAAFGSRFGIG